LIRCKLTGNYIKEPNPSTPLNENGTINFKIDFSKNRIYPVNQIKRDPDSTVLNKSSKKPTRSGDKILGSTFLSKLLKKSTCDVNQTLTSTVSNADNNSNTIRQSKKTGQTAPPETVGVGLINHQGTGANNHLLQDLVSLVTAAVVMSTPNGSTTHSLLRLTTQHK
jgi:hypothetical protein